MGKEEKSSTIKVLISAMVLIILAVAFLTAIADQSNLSTQRTLIDDETHNLATCVSVTDAEGWEINESNSACNITVTNAPTGWKQEDCQLGVVVVENGTGTALTLDTDYAVFADTGIIQMLDTTATENLTGNNTYLDYSYCGDGYVSQSWGRTVLDTNVGIYAIAVLVIVVLLVYTLLKREEDY